MVQKIKPKKHLMKKYTPKNNVESIFSVIKKIQEQIKINIQDYKTNKQDSKQQHTTSIEQ